MCLFKNCNDTDMKLLELNIKWKSSNLCIEDMNYKQISKIKNYQKSLISC